jgi:RNA polymerase sigma-70 factor
LLNAETAARLHTTLGGGFCIIQVMASRPVNGSTSSVDVQTGSSQLIARFRESSALIAVVERCWKKAVPPEEWNLTREQFVAALERSAAHRFQDGLDSHAAIEAYLSTLHLSDLALACACSAGNPAAWDFFVTEFRPELYRAARAIAGDRNARELADSLYADLYGLSEREGRRKSLFDYFHGQSKLATWLRAVLAQRHVDEIRRARKTEPLEDATGQQRPELLARSTTERSVLPDPARMKYLATLQAALMVILSSLDSRDRLRLAYYYVDDRTLAEIGRLLGEHEATVSRKLERTRRDVRRRVEAALREEKKWTEAQVRLCLEYACDEWPFALAESMLSARSPLERPDTASAPD